MFSYFYVIHKPAVLKGVAGHWLILDHLCGRLYIGRCDRAWGLRVPNHESTGGQRNLLNYGWDSSAFRSPAILESIQVMQQIN